MGKKGKIGKARKDKFYHLAKETGFRARSAFKLLQLNRKFEFLENSRVCVDLCAAPGGWLQVASEKMPISSVIIGVDLVPIKPIRNVITLQEDITTDKCRQNLKKQLQNWKADIVLHDGAPNVGKSWTHDAFSQATLTLQALKLATDFLKKGGYFVTKVFRSKDYNCLLWVFQQMFKKVLATKPAASRLESAEIFVVCQGYIAPDQLDTKFTDPKYVFQELPTVKDSKKAIIMLQGGKKHKSRGGYEDDDHTLHHKLSVNDFLEKSDFLDLLADSHQIILDNEAVLNSPLTTEEIKTCCSDIQVLGRGDIKKLLIWRKKICADLKKAISKEKEKELQIEEVTDDDDDDDDNNLEEKIAKLKREEMSESKKKRKKEMKNKRKIRDKIDLNMVIPGDKMDINEDAQMFNLKKIKNEKQIKTMVDSEEELDDEKEIFDNDDDNAIANKKLMATYERYADEDDDTFPGINDEDNSDEDEDDPDEIIIKENAVTKIGFESNDKKLPGNPLIVDLNDEPESVREKALWFDREAFKNIDDDDDEIYHETESESEIENRMDNDDEVKSVSSDASGSSYDMNELTANIPLRNKSNDCSKLEVVSTSGNDVKNFRDVSNVNIKLDPVSLAIGEELVKSRKRRRELIEESYNRFISDDTNLPDWFVKDEKKNYRRNLPVTKEQVQEYKERLKVIDARPIKKVAEAKARKKRKSIRKLEKARKKAEGISNAVDVSDKEKMRQIRDIYKRAGVASKKNKDVSYVVAKRGTGKKVSRPAGIKGQFKVVDPRMKKDNRKLKIEKKREHKKGGGKRNKKKTSRNKT